MLTAKYIDKIRKFEAQCARARAMSSEETPFEKALRAAQEALTHLGTGELRPKPIVREGPRSYESGGRLEKRRR